MWSACAAIRVACYLGLNVESLDDASAPAPAATPHYASGRLSLRAARGGGHGGGADLLIGVYPDVQDSSPE